MLSHMGISLYDAMRCLNQCSLSDLMNVHMWSVLFVLKILCRKKNLLGVDYLNSGLRNVEIQIIVEMEKFFLSTVWKTN